MIKRLHSTLFYAKDIERTLAFYKKLGFPAKKEGYTVKIQLGDFRLVFTDENSTLIQNESGMKPKGLGIYTYVEVDDVDAYFSWLKKHKIPTRTEPRDWPWGKREFVVRDPDGYKIVFYSACGVC